MTDPNPHQREQFGSRLAFYFAAVGSGVFEFKLKGDGHSPFTIHWCSNLSFLKTSIAVGFGNVWRFPALSYSYGGGAFFIPYILALLFVGLPVLFLEIALGQYYQRGDVSVFSSVHKRLRGVGLSSIATGLIVRQLLLTSLVNPF